MEPIKPKHIRYIKLGAGGRWEERALTKGEIYFGMPDEPQELIAKHDWDGVARHFRTLGRSPGMSSYIARENREFETLGPDCLWITFSRRRLWWGFAEPGVTVLGGDGTLHGTRMRRIINGWQDKDITGNPLAQERLSTKLTQVASYRHTMCSVKESDYLVRKINGDEDPLAARAAEVRDSMMNVASDAIAGLHWADFETLIDLIFMRAGWQRVSRLGGTQKDIDLELENPSTEERAFVQIKSRATQTDVNSYLGRFEQGNWNRMFFVCHTPDGQLTLPSRQNLHLWTRETLATAVIRAGLYDWAVQKAT